ncbi:MAG: hypothetical protein AMJ54_04580 [Deltaproteobacteria bacterium SG8_13]|nr:MAG: hypothetical protein AMJ54_04580 [Deltaproteobacteria bacterium SG8_13]
MKMTPACTGCKIQSRSIDISSFECDDEHIVVSGELCDRRLVPTTDLKGNPNEAGVVHQLRICMKVATRTLVIEEIEADMQHFPHEECAGMHRSVEAIRGLTLSPGFSSRVKKKVGGRNGCIHLTTLLLAMAPAALQGYWVHNDRKPERRQISGKHLEQYLIDTCRVWRREGPLVKMVSETAGIDLPEKNVKKPSADR